MFSIRGLCLPKLRERRANAQRGVTVIVGADKGGQHVSGAGVWNLATTGPKVLDQMYTYCVIRLLLKTVFNEQLSVLNVIFYQLIYSMLYFL